LEITGVAQNGPEARVNYTFKWVVNPSLPDLNGTAFFQRVKLENQPETQIVRLYDDGWKVDTTEARRESLPFAPASGIYVDIGRATC
jgi:hypothetical protein